MRVVAPDFLALTIFLVVFFVGVLITQRVALLRSYNVPAPIAGGFVAALTFSAVYEIFGLAIRRQAGTTRYRIGGCGRSLSLAFEAEPPSRARSEQAGR